MRWKSPLARCAWPLALLLLAGCPPQDDPTDTDNDTGVDDPCEPITCGANATCAPATAACVCDDGYDDVDGYCLDAREVPCSDQPPAHAASIPATVTITYQDGFWGFPATCEWSCVTGAHPWDGGCALDVAILDCATAAPLTLAGPTGGQATVRGEVQTGTSASAGVLRGVLARLCTGEAPLSADVDVDDLDCATEATYAGTVGDRHGFDATLALATTGEHAFLFAFSGDGGEAWTLCDAAGPLDGATIMPGLATALDPAGDGPLVVSVDPGDGAQEVAVDAAIVVRFDQPMDPASLKGPEETGACGDAVVQVSFDDFASCVGLDPFDVVLEEGDRVVTLRPSPRLTYNLDYQVRIGTGALNAAGVALQAAHDETAFSTPPLPATCGGPLVISQVYGAGGQASTYYANDYVELLNRTSEPITLDGWTLQYASANATTWGASNRGPLAGVVPAHGYFLIALNGGTSGEMEALPDPDHAVGVNMTIGSGKVAIVAGAAGLTSTCGDDDPVVDLVGYGDGNCPDGGMTSQLTNTTAAHRRMNGCIANAIDARNYRVAPVLADDVVIPRNSGSPPVVCGCPEDEALNVVSGTPEATGVDHCVLWAPSTMTATRFELTGEFEGRVTHPGVTDQGGAPVGLLAQVGVGPQGGLPWSFTGDDYGWAYYPAVWVGQTGTEDATSRYIGWFPAPADFQEVDYAVAYRFSLDDGASWMWCDLTGTGANHELPFSYTDTAVLTVAP